MAQSSSVFEMMHTFQAAVEEMRVVSLHHEELRDQPSDGCKAPHSSIISQADHGKLITDETGQVLITLPPPGTVVEDPLDNRASKARYRILAAYRSRRYSMFWPIRKKDDFKYVTLSKGDTDEDLLERNYPTTWPEGCDLLQKQYVEKYVKRWWRKKAGWKFVAVLDPTCEQWQECLILDERFFWSMLVNGEQKVKKSIAMPGRAKDNGHIVLFVLERGGDWEEYESQRIENEQESILDEEIDMCVAQEAVVVDGKGLRVTVRGVKNES